jgi:hypothetical protein
MVVLTEPQLPMSAFILTVIISVNTCLQSYKSLLAFSAAWRRGH